MRLWSLHPKYLDRMGLLAVWREGLLAQSVLLKGEYTKCRFHLDVLKEIGQGYKQFSCMNDALQFSKEIPYFNGSIYTHDGHVFKEDFNCKCKGTGKSKTPYWNHPQLERFQPKPMASIGNYLYFIYCESQIRGYKFNVNKINLDHDDWIVDCPNDEIFMTVTKRQLEYEFVHLQDKLLYRNPKKCSENINITYKNNKCKLFDINKVKPHPLFKVIEGNIESWEKI